MLTKRCLILIFVSFLFVTGAFANLELIVKSNPDWGPMSNADVEYLCQYVVDLFEKNLRPENRIDDAVNVYRTNVGYNFATLDIDDPEVKYKIGIQPIEYDGIGYRITDFFYLIQPFTHEFLHVLQDKNGKLFDNEKDPNVWLMEGIATMSSIWSLREMAKTWGNDPRFGTELWQADGTGYNFSQSFNHFATNALENAPRFQLEGTPKEWLEKYEDGLREISISKGKAGLHFPVPPEQLAFQFLPVFEKNPQAWNIIPKMPFTKSKMPEYMQDWYNSVDDEDKQFVEMIAEIMSISITKDVIVKTPNITTDIARRADINNDGYVDIHDVLIIRAAINGSTMYDTDVNSDGFTDEQDLLIVKAIAMQAIAAASPKKRKIKITTWGKMKIK